MLSKKKKYLQIALNSSLDDAKKIISQLPVSDRIIIEAGTPLLKTYGRRAIIDVASWWKQKMYGPSLSSPQTTVSISQISKLFGNTQSQTPINTERAISTYIVADYKAMDRGSTEVNIASNAGASAITVLGHSPTETIDSLIEECNKRGIDSIIDMMNVDKPYQVLRKLKKLPQIVMLHRGVDETEMGTTPLPIHMINKIRGAFDVMIAIGGGDTIREVQSAFFNGADIVMLWKEFYQARDNTAQIAQEFLKQIK